MGMIGYFAEIDSEKINQLLESTEKPLMDNIHDTLSGLRRLDIDKRWDFLHFGLTGTSAFDPAKNDPLSRAVLGEHSLEDGIDGFLGLTWNQELAATIDRLESLDLKWFTEFGHLNRGDMLTSEQHRCHNEKKKFQRRV
ncbi:YfbM family protein, partial [Escherichia coli]|nr:YfbM family protein [Escherichia coli]MCV8674324.1 YfbM family protein [Escherichia coli]